MPHLLAAASILVATAGAVSLLLLLPAAGLAETAGESNAAGRARVWLAALILPPLVGALAAATALWLHAQGIVASPHIGGQRPHLCLLPLYGAPAGAYRLSIFSWLALALLALALLRLIGGALSSHLLRRLAVANGAPASESSPRCALYEVQLSRATSFNAGLLRPVVVVSTALRQALPAESFTAVVARERAHCARRDNLASLLADACAALLILLPTVYYFRSQWRSASEAAADDAALAAGVQREHLLDALQAMRGAAPRSAGAPSLASLLIPQAPVAEQRLARLLAGDDQARGPARSSAVVWAVGIAVVLLLAVMLLAGTRSIQDSLYCAAEQLIRAAR